jgi:hypothetical protein
MALFRDDQDAHVFLRLLEEGVQASGCALWAYILMTNHFHAALRGTSVQLQRCMRYTEGIYASYHNKKYGLSGAAFEGRYEAYPQGSFAMLLRTIAYIFANPVAAGLVRWPRDYAWSNYASYSTSEMPAIGDDADLLLDLLSQDVQASQNRLQTFIERELARIERGQHRPGLTAKDIQANHFDWLLTEAESRVRRLEHFDALTIAVYWAKTAGFHSGAIRKALGGPVSSSLRANLSRLRSWLRQDPERAAHVTLP